MIVNLQDVSLEVEEGPSGHRFAMKQLGNAAGSTLTGITVYEIEPGQATWPYHFEVVEEEWLIVIAGEVMLRTPDGERALRAGDVAAFPPGAAGAHAVRNAGAETARFAMPSSRARFGDAVVYPDSGKFRISTAGFSHRGFLGYAAEYWEDE